jgi:hypothetical protein
LKETQQAAVARADEAEALRCEEAAKAAADIVPMEEDTECDEGVLEATMTAAQAAMAATAPTGAVWDAAKLRTETDLLRARIQEALKSDLPAEIKEPTLVHLRKKLAALPKQIPKAAPTGTPGNLRRDLAEAQINLANLEEAKKEITLSGRTQEAAQQAIILAAETELQAIRFRGGALLEDAERAIKRAAEVLVKINELLEANAPPPTPPARVAEPHLGEQKTLAMLQSILEMCKVGPDMAKGIHDKMHEAFALASIMTPIPSDAAEALQPCDGSTKPLSWVDDELATGEDGAKPAKIKKLAAGSVSQPQAFRTP